jgi:hypothetical protein
MKKFSHSRTDDLRRIRLQSLSAVAICMLLSSCGIIANRKPIPSGLPTATVHFGPMRSGLRTQSIRVNDGEFCRPAHFSRFHTVGAYLGSDVDVLVPAGQALFVSLSEMEAGACSPGLCIIECAGGVSLSPSPGTSYIARLERKENQCRVVVNSVSKGTEVPVDTKPEPERCLF